MNLSNQLTEALHEEDGKTVHISDEELIRFATEVAQKDPRKRFGASGVQSAIAAAHGAKWVRIEGESLDKRIRRLAGHNGPFVADRANTFKLAKRLGGSGLEFKKSDADTTDVYIDGKMVGEIRRHIGSFKGSTSEREITFAAEVEVEGKVHTSSFLATLTAAKNWVKGLLR